MIRTLYLPINKKLILKEEMKRNGMLYSMNEERAFKYMKLFLPISVLNGTENQNIISLLRTGLIKFIHEQKQQSFDMKNPSKWYDVLLLMSEYSKKCVENGKGILGEHFKDMITKGLLLSANCKSKRGYNFFYNHAKMINLFKFGMLRVPANSSMYTLVDVPENITDYSKLIEEYNRYFNNQFAL
jgi:hypothetical protein